MASGTAQGMQRTLPWSWYTDPELLRLEQERVFRRGWQYAGPAEHAAEPGDLFTCSVGDATVVVRRGREGELHALLNARRGLAVEAWGPLVFVNPDAAARPLAETLGPLPELLAGGGIELDRLRFRRRSEFELACNWKVAVENYLECYHCAVAHPGFSAVVDVSPEAYRLATHALGSSQFGPTRNGGGPAEGTVEGQFHWLWPVTKVYSLPGPPNLAAGPIAPAGPERTSGFLDYFFPEDVTDEQVEELLAFDDQVGLEDRALVEGVQAGLRAGLLDEGRLLPESERLLAHFQGLVREALA